jgi:hypothetical protein
MSVCDASVVGGFADRGLETTDAYPLAYNRLPPHVSFRARAGGASPSRGGLVFLWIPPGDPKAVQAAEKMKVC